MPKKEKWKGKAMEIRGSWAKLFDARPSDFLAYPFECLPVCLPVRRLMMVMQSEHSCPPKISVVVFVAFGGCGCKCLSASKGFPVRQFGRFGVCHNTALPRLRRKETFECNMCPGFGLC